MFNRLRIIVLCFLIMITTNALYAQRVPLMGKINNEEDFEGILILNKTSGKHSTSNREGRFEIDVKQNDILLLISMKYLPKSFIVSNETVYLGYKDFFLEAAIYELDEVRLSSSSLDFPNNLLKMTEDINDAEEIVSVREALGYGTKIDVEVLYKHISGYYKKLEKLQKWKTEDQTAYEIANLYSPAFLSEAYKIPKEKSYDFILFCIETSSIMEDFKNKNYNLVLNVFKENSKIFNERISGDK